METVNFQCGHCHKLMAVSREFLGQQVRCPHCQQVVLAPGPAPAPAPAELPTIEVPRHDEIESIFTPPEAAGEDLFGSSAAPRIEFPTEPAFPRLALEEPTMPTETAGEPVPLPAPEANQPTITYTEPEPPASLTATEVMPPEAATPTATTTEPFAPAEEAPAPPPEESLPISVESRHRVRRSNPWVIPLIIAPLAFYSFMATLYILDTKYFHFMTPPPPPHPLEILPDLEGDNKGGAVRGGKRGSVDVHWPSRDLPLPAHLRVPLGGTLAIGDLEVKPEKVERKRISYDIPGYNPTPAQEDSLAVTLRLRNRSTDVTFKPMDRFFARDRASPSLSPQYTLLEMGERKFYGGPLKWLSLVAARDKRSHIEFVEKQGVNRELKPGEEMTTFVCTNPDDHAVEALENYQGPLLWHVQLRRGLVKWTTKNGVERDDPATAVVGIEFTAADVKKAVN
jgi:hypothetical protein